MLHHLMVGTWTPPGAIYTIEFDDEALSLRLLKKTIIAQDEPISWMTFDVGELLALARSINSRLIPYEACEEEHIWSVDEEVLQL